MGKYDEAREALAAGQAQARDQAQNPAAPKGMRQMAAGSVRESKYAEAGKTLQPWLPTEYVEQSQGWYTGANTQGTKSGWNTGFVESYNSGWNSALREGTAADYFRNGGTGVVLWDHDAEDGRKFEFGDVVEQGEVVSNVYRDFDETTANLMLLPWMADGTTQRRLWDDAPGDAEVARRVGEFVAAKKDENNASMEQALGAMEYQGDVAETQADFQEGGGDELLAGLGGAAGGAATFGAAGFLVGGPVGGLIGGVGGAAAGAIGGLMNKDEIAEAAARSYETYQLAREEEGAGAALGTGLAAAGQLGMKLTSPLQNLTRGATDWKLGDVGDGVSERYAVDEKGDSKAPTWMKIADWGSLVGDSVLQFVSPLSRAVYMTQMGASIGGEVTTLASTGKMFDPREGRFDNIFVDDDGKADPASALAGIAKIGIDVVQLGGLRGLARQSDEAGAALKGGTAPERMAGMKFTLDDAGNVVGAKRTMALLAPSEQIAWRTTVRDARVAARKEGRAVSADDYYRAASNLANGSNKLKTAMVNAFGEGYEEFAQALLEPVALDGEVSGKEAIAAFGYGAAAGLGMSAGATFAAPGNDARMMAQAYVLETIRNDGVEPDFAAFKREWDSLDVVDKRVRVARSKADVEVTRAAMAKVGRDNAATVVASELDAAKAVTALRKTAEMEARSATTRTDRYHVMGGVVDLGRVSPTGSLLGDTAPAEAVEASARTIHALLADRLAGVRLQVDTLTRQVEEYDAKGSVVEADEAREKLATAQLMVAWGEGYVADVAQYVEMIYGETTTAAQAQAKVRELNELMRKVFALEAPLLAPAGFEQVDPAQLQMAAAQFTSLIQSREPKLDAGSYLAQLPRASWQLTEEGADNFIQVNVDILQAINGDFDGDKLRAENQLILSSERFVQARAGQLFGGAGREIDIATRNFDEALAAAVGRGLQRPAGTPLRDEAEATMTAIRTAITTRYGSLMSPEALARVFTEFETAVSAGSADARTTLLTQLAHEAGGAINDLGREKLNNEWLWASKIVRANFNAYQTQYRKLRNLDDAGRVINAPTAEEAAADFDTPEGTNRRKERATTDAQTLSLWAAGTTLFRQFQKIHYTWYNSSVLRTARAELADLYQMAAMYEELAQFVTEPELARTGTTDSIAGSVLVMLDRLVESAMTDPKMAKRFNPDTAMTLFANLKVKDVWFEADGPVEGQGGMTLLQVLLKRALDADYEKHKATFHLDEKLQSRHATLRAMTVPNHVDKSVNAERAFIEVFKGVAFGNSLGGLTGNLGAQQTPEQWLRNYVAHDREGREDLERFYTNTPEYLDRKDRSNIPYSMKEMARGEITAYRSMMDAMLAVGRSELTFDPSKGAGGRDRAAFGGRRADIAFGAVDGLEATHAQVRSAMKSFRKILNRTEGDRAEGARLAQDLLEANPREGKSILDTLPDALAAAVYEFRDGELYVAPWVYEFFAIEDSKAAAFYYWKNLTLAKWNATQVEGRRYERLQTRFERLLYQLDLEPGQTHLEVLIRKMDSAKSIDEFFYWLNTTPGFRGQQAVLLPFHDDVADFEADAAGAWTTSSDSSDLRIAIATASKAAEQLNKTLVFRARTDQTDRLIIDDIKAARDGDKDPAKQEQLRQLKKALEISHALPRGFAPTAMLALTRGVLNGVDAGMHEKGKTGTSYKEVGEFQALMDAFSFVPGLERVMETLTAHDISSLSSNLGDVAKHGGAAMDADGRQIEWEQLDLDQLIEMLDNPRTRPLAYALLTPSSLDIGPTGLSERLLMQASLKEILAGDHFKKQHRTHAKNQLAVDMEYLSTLDARARSEGGHFDATRIANDLAIAMTSGLKRRSTPDDRDRLTAQAYRTVATIMRMIGNVQSTPDLRGTNVLEELRKWARKELNDIRKTHRLPGFTDTDSGTIVEEWVKGIKDDLRKEFEEQKRQTLASALDRAAKRRRIESQTAAFKQNIGRIESILDDNRLASVVARFELTGDPVLDQPQQARITEYVLAMASFPARVPEAADAWAKLETQRRNGLTPDLDPAEWDMLSRAAMGLTMVDDSLQIGSHVQVPMLPKAPDPKPGENPSVTDARFYKYFDPSFSFFVDDLLDGNTPLAKAAVWHHAIAEQPREMQSIDDLKRVVSNTLLRREDWGPWTPGIMAQMIEGQQRMDSAGGPPGIAAAGNGPKRWALVAAATRRRGKVPPPELLTSLSITADRLAADAHPFNEVEVQPAGATEPTSMPVALLENRFYASIKIDGFDVLQAVDNLGFEWDGADQPNPYRYVSLERLRPILLRHAKANGITDLADITVEVEFFHPDSQPAGAWHNAFFEGMSHSLLPDGSESLIATLWSDNGGQIAKATQWTIDAGKKGLRALMPFRRLRREVIAEADALWAEQRDFAGMLRRKTELAAAYDDGSGAVGPEAYNAIFKIMKLQHIVVGQDADGNPAAMTADEVIAFQAANGKAADLPLADAKLVKLSPDVLRSMLGETGSQGVDRLFDDEFMLNPSMVDEFIGITPTMLGRFLPGWAQDSGRLGDSALRNISTQRVQRVRTVMTKEERNARHDRRVYLDERSAKVGAARSRRKMTDDMRRSYVSILDTAIDSVGSERTPFDFGAVNAGFITPRNMASTMHSVGLLEDMKVIQDGHPNARGWLITDESRAHPDYTSGTLTVTSLGDKREPEHWVVRGDLALVPLDKFQRPEYDDAMVRQRVEKALNFLADSGAYIILGPGNGQGDVRFEAAMHLESLGYVQVAGSPHIYQPAENVYYTQNEKAYASTLLETKKIRPARQAITFLSIDPLELDENDAILNPESTKLRDRALVGNLLQSSSFPNYNLLIEDNRNHGLYARTLNHLRTITDPAEVAHRAHLLGMGGNDPAGFPSLEESLDKFHRKITTRASLELEVGDEIEVGDIIPFVHPDGKVILYRHGMKLPRPRDLDALHRIDGMNVALAQSEPESRATSNSGRINNIEDRSGYGKRLVLELPLQPYGDKVQLEWNGMKYIVVPKPASMGKVPPLFRNGSVVDLLSDLASADSKEAYEGRVSGYRNALAFFQYDFTDDLVQFFFPGADPNDGDQAGRRLLTYTLLKQLSRQDGFRIPFRDARTISKANIALANELGEFAASQAAASKGTLDTSWLDRLADPSDPSALISQAVITYLLTPGANVDNVLKSAGFSHPRAGDSAVETRLVPGLFAELLDNGMDSALHTELIRRFDAQLRSDGDGSGWKLHTDWTVEMFDERGKSLRGYLQFGEAHSTGDNPVLDGQAYTSGEAAPASIHNALASSASLGADTAHKDFERTRAFARAFTRDGAVTKFEDGADGVWHMLTALPDEKDLSLVGWRRETPAETIRRARARDEIVGLYRPLNTEGWDETAQQQVTFRNRAARILGDFNLHGAQLAMVETWVRMYNGRPHGLNEDGSERGIISFDDAMEALDAIEENRKNHRLPTTGFEIPLMDVNHLTVLFTRNQYLPDGGRWELWDNDGTEITSWDSWVAAAFGSAWIVEPGKVGIGPKPRFDSMFLLAVDGLMHGYQNATTSTRYLPVSSDVLRQRLLMDEKTNKMLVSISKDENILAASPAIWNSAHADLEDIVSGQRIYSGGRNGPEPGTARARNAARRAAWRRDRNAPRPRDTTMESVRAQGNAFIGYTTSTSALYRSMMNLRVGNTLFNLSLMFAAPVEALVRRTVNLFANVATGEATGASGMAMTWMSDHVPTKNARDFLSQLGWETTYTMDQHKRINTLVSALASLPEFKAMVYKELMFQYPSAPGIGPIEKWLERYAKFGAKMQDPTIGMRPEDLARTYLEAALRRISTSPTGQNVYGIDEMLAALPRDPNWLQTADPEAHRMGIASVANVRSVKPNVLSLGFRGFVDALSENPKFLPNTAGNMLKILTAFQNFWANYGTSITGLQGPVDFMAFWLDGKEKKITARAQAALAGVPFKEMETEYFDMSEALESIDLADSFIKGGVTHSGLFALGMMASGLGLGGEDEEEKLRRRQAELQGVPVLHDPRDMVADFRNKDTIYLNWLPFGMDSFFKVDPNNPDSQAMAQMNWVTRTFLSPVIGMERFFNSGDFSEVLHGFKDAIGSHPIVNATLWNSAADTFGYLHEQANDASEKGDYEQGGHLLMTAVGVMERMLFENAMVNLVYVGKDEWDRDPYVQTLKDSDGTIQRDIMGNARKQNIALQNYISDTTGEVQTGYLGRSQQGADLRVLTENRATMAFVSALFTGGMGDSDFWRYNMAIKTREIEKPALDQETAEAYIRAAAAFQLSLIGGEANLNVTADELKPQVATAMYSAAKAAGTFDPNLDDKIWVAARAMAAEKGTAALSILDEVGREVLTDKGARATFEGLKNGTIQVGELSQLGVFIPYPTRQKIAAEWSEELIQEGIDLGLDETKAKSRMNRIMQGGFGGPAESEAGLADILFDTRIPVDGTQVYGQLNTSYVMGPDGRPWATGFKRDGLLGAAGLAPLRRMLPPDPGVTGMDARGNTVDLVNGMNTGLRALVPMDKTWNVPTDKEIGDMIAKAIEEAASKQYQPSKPWDDEKGGGSGSGWRNFGRRGYGGYGGGGGGGGYFSKMYSLPDQQAPYGNSVAYINTSNPILRRAFVRRERISTERGRLNQWQ